MTAVMCHKALSSPTLVPDFKLQLLSVPVMDNTANPQNNASWAENELTPALPAAKMMWYRHHYLPDPETWADPEASPKFYDGDSWGKQPRALVVVGELDVLRDEGLEYAARLEKEGVRVEVLNFKGMPHPFLAMDEALSQGRDTITAMVEALKDVFEI